MPNLDNLELKNATKGDDFVGFQCEDNKTIITFPMGYRIADKENDRVELVRDIGLLSRTIRSENRSGYFGNSVKSENSFPFYAYQFVLNYYYSHNCTFYHEIESRYDIRDNGKISWSKTIKHTKPTICGKTIFYEKQVRRYNYQSETNILTKINQYCVYEAYEMINFMYTDNYPDLKSSKRGCLLNGHTNGELLEVLNNKLTYTHADETKKLMSAMIEIISYRGKYQGDFKYNYGVDKFWKPWEDTIKSIFMSQGGLKQTDLHAKADATFVGDENTYSTREPLRPDCWLVNNSLNDNNKHDLYIIDAKYYQYGINRSSRDTNKIFPSTADVNKQFSYEDIFSESVGNDYDVKPSSFLMPFGKNENENNMVCTAKATCQWNNGKKLYAILVDTKYAIQTRYYGSHIDAQRELINILNNPPI